MNLTNKLLPVARIFKAKTLPALFLFLCSYNAMAIDPDLIKDGLFEIDADKLDLERKAALTDNTEPFCGVVKVPLKNADGPVSYLVVYMKFNDVFKSGYEKFIYADQQSAYGLCLGVSANSSLEYAEVSLPELDNYLITSFKTTAIGYINKEAEFSIVNNGETAVSAIFKKNNSILTYSQDSPVISNSLKDVVNFYGYESDDNRRVTLRFNRRYTYYDIAAPVFSCSQAIIPVNQTIGLSTVTKNAKIRYSVNGVEPGFDSGDIYSEPFTLLPGLSNVSATTVHNTETADDNLPHGVVKRTFFATDANKIATIEFTPEGLINMDDMTTLKSGADINLEGIRLTSDNCNLSFTFSNGAILRTAETPYIELKEGATITVTNHSVSNRLNAMQFIGEYLSIIPADTESAQAYALTNSGSFIASQNLYTNEAGTTESKTFIAAKPGRLSSVQFAGSAVPTGADIINIDNEHCTPVYFNLQGIQVKSEALTPGIYIRVQDGESSRILVR